MKTNKKGISLIVLVITIIVIIILAAAVILTINNNNPMDNANKAKYSSDRATMQQALTTTIGTVMGDEMVSPTFTKSDGSAIGSTSYETITDGKIYFKAGQNKGTIVFGTVAKSTTDKQNLVYPVGYELPKYGTAAGSTTWAINEAGNLKLTVGTGADALHFDGVTAGK